VAGRAKTRLCPPCTPEQAAALAEAALRDTLETVAAVPAGRYVLALDGLPGSWLPPAFEVVPQRGTGLDERLAAAFDDVGGPALLVGMDTPQLRPWLVARSMRRLEGADAVLGRSFDGGYWAIGLRAPDARVFLGVPMSRAHTGAAQLERLHELGLYTRALPELRDVDTIADALAVAEDAPRTRFARVLRELTPGAAAA
jgi:glycosyltransferase A (GT-A) superfamily protein (DUF2064 family)